MAGFPESPMDPCEVRILLLHESSLTVWHCAGCCCLCREPSSILQAAFTASQHAGTESCTASPQIFSTFVPKWLHGKHPPWKIKPREASPAPLHTPHQFGSDTVASVQVHHRCEEQQTYLWRRVLSCGSHLLCVKWALVPFFHRRSLCEHPVS